MIPTYRNISAITVLTWRDQLSDSSTMTPRKRVSVFLSIGVWEIFNGQGRATLLLENIRPFTLEKIISSKELEGTARTRPDILKVVLGPLYVQNCQCEASEQKLGQKPESELKVIELSYCHHSICLKKTRILKKK